MYRNCPEHPVIKEMLKKGEATGTAHTNCCADNDNSELVRSAIYYLSEQEFAENCVKRRIARGLLTAERSEACLT